MRIEIGRNLQRRLIEEILLISGRRDRFKHSHDRQGRRYILLVYGVQAEFFGYDSDCDRVLAGNDSSSGEKAYNSSFFWCSGGNVFGFDISCLGRISFKQAFCQDLALRKFWHPCFCCGYNAPDVISQLLLALPMIGLYEVGLLFIRYVLNKYLTLI